MSIIYFIVLIIIAFIALGLWFRSGEDLTAWDQPPEPAACDFFSRPGGASQEHQEVARQIHAQGLELNKTPLKTRLPLMREFMDSLAEGRQFNTEFVPANADEVPAEWVLAPNADATRRMLYIHGGAFFAGSPKSHRTLTSRMAELTGAAVLAIDYRLMPENKRAAGIEDCRTAYRWMLDNGPDGPAPVSTVFAGGDSAGGNLVLSLLLWIRDQGLRAPNGVVALSPVVDATHSGPSIKANLKTDLMLAPLFSKIMRMPALFLSWYYVLETRFRPTNPVVSPLFGDLSNLPPILIHVSEAELLLDDARRFVNKARAQGSPVRLQIWADMLHVWQIFNPEVPEAVEALDQIGRFLRSAESA
jgi:monoterpene epsilon-lactone hydrolase